MRTVLLVPYLVMAVMLFAKTSSLLGQELDEIIYDVTATADGSVEQARLEAQRQVDGIGPTYRSYRKDERKSFSGEYVPPELPEDKKGRYVYGLALFSDDGSNVTVKGSQIHTQLRKPQHLPDLEESFHVLPVAIAPGQSINITVDYSNTIYNDDPGTPGYPDVDGCALFLYLIPIELAVDANRDGQIQFGRARDTTEEDKPFRFWCNDDNDGTGNGAEVSGGAADLEDNEIRSKRDLEDFARLWLRIGGLHKEIAAGTIRIGLKWRDTGGASINVNQAAEANGRTRYLTNNGAATSQTSGDYKMAKASVTGTAPAILRTDVFANVSEQRPNTYFLFEGVSEGKGQLVVTLHTANGTETAEGPGVWLDIMNVKSMYQRSKALPDGIAAPHHSPGGPFSGPTVSVSDPWNWMFEKDPAEESRAVVFVHGWSMTYDAYFSFAETMFKRLWHQGFKGRFCAFRWDPLVAKESQLYAGEYNRSEHRALLYGQALKQFVDTIKSDDLQASLIGHSMGNVVCGSALQQGLSVQNYLLMQAAFPAGCYDESGGRGLGGINSYERFWDAETSNPTPDYHQTLNGDLTKGYRGFIKHIVTNVAGDMVNFHNGLDFALATGVKFFWFRANWEKNEEDYKPDGSTAAIHDPDWRYVYDSSAANLFQMARLENLQFINSSPIWSLTRYVDDSYEIKAFVARPRSKAVGAVDAGFGNRPANMRHVNLQDYGFDRRESDHSGQFNRRIQQVGELYGEILNIIQPLQ